MVPQNIHSRIEFFRNSMALLPAPKDPDPGMVLWVQGDKPGQDRTQCNCAAGRKKTCSHIKEFSTFFKEVNRTQSPAYSYDAFQASTWHAFAEKLFEFSKETPDTIGVEIADDASRPHLRVVNAKQQTLCLFFLSPDPTGTDHQNNRFQQERFMERCWNHPEPRQPFRRLDAIRQMALLTMTATERAMAERGAKTRRQAFEESFWHKFAYHLFREQGDTDCILTASIEGPENIFFLNGHDEAGVPVFQIPIPDNTVPDFLPACTRLIRNTAFLKIHPVPMKPIVRAGLNRNRDLVLHRYVRLMDEDDSEPGYYKRQTLEKVRFGDLFYLKDRQCFARIEQPDIIAQKFNQAFFKTVKNSRIPHYIDTLGENILKPPHIVDESVQQLKIIKTFDSVAIKPEAIQQDWHWISLTYGFGNQKLSLWEILQAKQEGKRFLPVTDGWIDCRSLNLSGFLNIPSLAMWYASLAENKPAKVSTLDLYRIQAVSEAPVIADGDANLVGRLNSLLEVKPSSPLPQLSLLKSTLRPYQKLGTEWLTFLYENRFGGLLCDDMGLGKTHQVMAFMAWLAEFCQKKNFLVVCPTTVLSHWETKIRDHMPKIKGCVYYGTDRNLNQAVHNHTVVITSYGILRRDITNFSAHHFNLIVFDEAQYIKNAATQVYDAARLMKADMKLCVTGTPIENRLSEMKALMDMVLPGYLGADHEFQFRYEKPIETNFNKHRKAELTRRIHPFTIRRLKQTVLQELPEKIEDIRTCRLSDDQIKLYNDAVSAKGSPLINVIRQGTQPIPYIHIFALLNLLKQICNHPVLLDDDTDDYETYASGKWELFKELLSESLASGQKVVIYSQFLKMIRIIKNYTEKMGVDCVSLTGSSRNRGELIRRFNHDPGCRVFIGSLKAGGAGIDLVAASVVIHYDRWWNAAKEDQATDRVHRIGQNRGVQVFKLVTEGTLEEKISAIIEKKRNLMDSIVREDDSGLLKRFSPEQLLDILALATPKDGDLSDS